MTTNADFVALAQNDTSKRPTPILKLSADAGTADYAGIFGRGSADLHARPPRRRPRSCRSASCFSDVLAGFLS